MVEILGREFVPVRSFLSPQFGYQNLGIACEVNVTHDHADDACRGGDLGLLVNRHVDDRWDLPVGVFVDRDTFGEDLKPDGPYTSLAVRPPAMGGDVEGGELFVLEHSGSLFEQEWDFLKNHSLKALEEAGVDEDATDIEKVSAFAEYAVKFKKSPTYDSFHPVDVILHSSYCTGAANVFFALANIHGLTCRSISIRNHSMVEVLIGDRWHFVDNHVDGTARFVRGFDYIDVTLNPQDFDGFTDKQKEYLSSDWVWDRSPWNYSSTLHWHFAWGESHGRGGRSDITDGFGVTVPCDPHHASALYPNREEYLFPLWKGEPKLTLTEKCSWIRAAFRLPEGESLVKQVFIEECDDNPVVSCSAEWWFLSKVEQEDLQLEIQDAGSSGPAEIRNENGVFKAVFDIPESVYAEGGEIDLVLENCSGKLLTAVAYPTPLVNPEPVSTHVPKVGGNGLSIEPI